MKGYPSGWHTTLMGMGTWYEYLALGVMGVYLLSFLLQGLLGARLGRTGAFISLALSGVAAVLALTVVVVTEEEMLNPRGISAQWVSSGGIVIGAGILLNKVAAVMLALVGFITFLVHWFSLEYMRNDPRLPRYWALLGLFALAMCGVVLVNNLFLIFVFWELVGFCSYLLIGFWFEKKAAGPASQKAFLVNRIGDLGFVLALMLLVAQASSFNLGDLKMEYAGNLVSGLNGTAELSPWIGCCLILGVMGKSAQFPLQVWLPDAMAGPTPVSSLLHAATMVAAGVYLLVRTEFLFIDFVPDLLVAVGSITALIAAFSALRQTDIKGVLAYSTISQLGFMVVAVGVGSSFYAFFHLITHAFFKCGLFLTAGAVIHQLHGVQHGSDEHFDAQDLRLMGGLGKKMPFVAGTYVVFAGALAGLPLFSGFFSKDGILLGSLEYGLEHGGLTWLPGIMVLSASLLTAFYITRHGLLIFGGKARESSGALERTPKANWTIRLPLLLLAFCSLATIKFLLDPWFASVSIQELGHGGHHLPELPMMALFVGLAVLGIGGAYFRWRSGAFFRPGNGLVHRLSKEHFFLDRIYEQGISKPVLRFADLLGQFDKRIVDGAVNGIARGVVGKDGQPSLSHVSAWFDARIIDGLVNRIASLVLAVGQGFRKLQSGNLQRYLLIALLALLLLLGALLYFA